MQSLLDNPGFASAYAALEGITLNPRRHLAANAKAHSDAVADAAVALARQNGCNPAEQALLRDLGHAHDIGKLDGHARPEASLARLDALGLSPSPELRSLIEWHDRNLPWWMAVQRGQPPSDRAWRRLAGRVDLRLLCLFCVADRIDAPGGWRRNAPARWFVEQAEARGLIPALELDLPGIPSERSAGVALVVEGRVVLIRVRERGFELPKGGIEFDELPSEAALRELREEAGVVGEVELGESLGSLEYAVETEGCRYTKRVEYFGARASADAFGPLPSTTRALHHASRDELDGVELVSEGLRPLLQRALA